MDAGGRKRKGAIRDWAELGSLLMLDYLVPFEDHCKLNASRGVDKFAEDHATRGRRPALSLSSYEYRVFPSGFKEGR